MMIEACLHNHFLEGIINIEKLVPVLSPINRSVLP